MPKHILVSTLVLLTLLATLAFGPLTASADQRDFTLVNGSRVTIVHVFVGPSEADDWGDDILGIDVLPPGDDLFIGFTRFDPGKCLYDIRVIGSNGAEGRLYGVNLCATNTVTFN